MADTRPQPFFVGDHPALDLLNSLAAPWSEEIEWLDGGADLLAWLNQAGMIDAEVLARFRGADTFGAADAVAAQARQLREWLRQFVQHRAGKPLTATVVTELAPLNQLLARDAVYRQVLADKTSEHPLVRRDMRHWSMPEQLLQPIADAIGDLVCNADFTLVKRCEGPTCTLWFYDRTKAHARRWCSMAVCGNRAKAAAHRERARGQAQ